MVFPLLALAVCCSSKVQGLVLQYVLVWARDWPLLLSLCFACSHRARVWGGERMVHLICVRSAAFEYHIQCEFLLCKHQQRSLLSIYIVSIF